MSAQVAQKFIDALHTLEETRDVEPIAALYAENAVAGNVLRPDQFHGPDGARHFWTEYRGTFNEAKSTFRNVIASHNRAALEWTTEGTSFDGKPLHYAGVTVLEAEGDMVTRSTAYFNPTVLGEQITSARRPLKR